jgi:8-oxo-dGTP pyrophosphatase MutT (NUDIX family)
MSKTNRKTKTVEKVTAFVTRDNGLDYDLLVFQHPNAGVQLPAGTVEMGESPEQAVLREVVEETGLQRVKIKRMLGQLSLVLPEDERIILRMTKLFDSPNFDASSPGGYGLERGSPVRVTGEAGVFSSVLCDLMDWSQQPPTRISGVKGFVRTSLLGSVIERHFFHLEMQKTTPDSWSISADGHVYQLYWQPIVPRPQIHPLHNKWLEMVYENLLASTGANDPRH